MGLSRLLQQHTIFRFRTTGFATQTWLHFSTSPSAGNKAQEPPTQKQLQAHEKRMDMHTGTFPKPSHLHKEIGGSWYTLKELLHKAKEKIFESLKVQSDSNNDVKSTSITKVMTTQENGLGKSGHGEARNTQENAVCSNRNIPPSAAAYKSSEISSDSMGVTVLDAKRPHNAMENTGRRKPRNITQTSSQMIFNTEDSSASRTISNATENLCSEVQLNATVLTGVCDAPYQTGLPEAASDSSVNSMKVEAVSNNQNHIQKYKECVQLKELQDPFEKSEMLSSVIYEAARPCQENIEDKMASTGCRNQVENKMYVDRYDKKLSEPLAAEPENGLLYSVGKPSEELLCSNAEVTSARLQESVPNTDVSVGNGLNQPENQQNFPGIPPDSKVSKEGGKPASGDAAQNLAELSSLFNSIVDHEAGKIMSKCNISETDGHLESLEGVSRGNLPNPLDMKGYPIGRQIAIAPGSMISEKTDQNHYSDCTRVLSQVNIQKLDDAGRKISSCHSYEEITEKDLSVEAPVKIVNKNETIYSQEKGSAESAVLNAKESKADPCVPPIRIRQLDKAQDTTSNESLDENKVLVKFVHKDADQREVIEILKHCGNILKILVLDKVPFKLLLCISRKGQG